MTEQKEETQASDIIHKISFKCNVCGTKFRGLLNKKRNNKKIYIYYYYKNNQKTHSIVCAEKDCYIKIENLFSDSSIDCMWCGKHPESNFKDDNIWDKTILMEDEKILNIILLCSRECKLSLWKYYNERRKDGGNITSICFNCKDSSTKMLKCGKCKLALYCSKGCQKEHWRIHKEKCV